jgi:signal transduction histidine kinase
MWIRFPGYTPLVDITRLNRIYFNLLSNAVKYTPEGGTITLKIRETFLPDERIRFTLTVKDNGIGMSSEFQKHLFEPFVQENRDDNSEMRGSGLGLAIVKKTVEAMGGTVSVDSKKGAGTEFTVVISSPCVRKTVLKEKENAADAGGTCLSV